MSAGGALATHLVAPFIGRNEFCFVPKFDAEFCFKQAAQALLTTETKIFNK